MNYYTKCWKCEQIIKRQSDCYYLHCNNGKYNFCLKCYNEFVINSKEFLRPERSKQKELLRSLEVALEAFHDKMVEHELPIPGGFDHKPTVLIHTKTFWDCEICEEIRNIR